MGWKRESEIREREERGVREEEKREGKREIGVDLAKFEWKSTALSIKCKYLCEIKLKVINKTDNKNNSLLPESEHVAGDSSVIVVKVITTHSSPDTSEVDFQSSSV